MQNESDAEDVSNLPVCGRPLSQETISGAGRALSDAAGYTELNRAMTDDSWNPFLSEDDFNLASWLVRSKVAKTQINTYFAKVWVAQRADHSAPPIPCDNTSPFSTYLVSTWCGQKPLSMMVDMQQLSFIRILLTMSATGSARSCIDLIWSMHLFGNMIRVGSDYILRYIQWTGRGINRYEISPDKF